MTFDDDNGVHDELVARWSLLPEGRATVWLLEVLWRPSYRFGRLCGLDALQSAGFVIHSTLEAARQVRCVGVGTPEPFPQRYFRLLCRHARKRGFVVSQSSAQQWEVIWRRGIRQAAVDRVRRRANPRQFQSYYLWMLQRLPLSRLTRLPGFRLIDAIYARFFIGHLVRQEIQQIHRQLASGTPGSDAAGSPDAQETLKRPDLAREQGDARTGERNDANQRIPSHR